jgi:hypothetical protein
MKHRRFLFPRALALAWLISLVPLAAVAQGAPPDPGSTAQSPIPVATYKLHIGETLKDDLGAPFSWALAPDNSIVISFGKLNGVWVVQRITGWETKAPKVQTVTFPFHTPERHYLHGEPVVSPSGDYLVVCAGSHKKTDTLKAVEWEEEFAVIDLRTFQLVSLVKHESKSEGDFLFFDNNGILILISSGSAAAVSLPELKPIAMCSHNVESTQRRTATETSDQDQLARDSCSALMSMAHVSTLTELRRNRPADPRWSIAMGGGECSRETISKDGNLELDRCGTVHFADPDGVFNTTFWHALRVYSVPDHSIIFSLPLHISEGTASGLFAQKDDHNYLVVRRGLTLLTYLLPERAI